MAVVLLFRVAIALAPVATRVVQTSGPGDVNAVANKLANFWSRLSDPGEDPNELAVEMSEAEGEVFYVTDFAAPFELRKLSVRFSRAPAGGTVEDQDVMTFHFLKTSGGAPGTYVDGTDLPAVETAFGTFWTACKTSYPTWVHLDQYRWYKDGPAFYELREDPPPAKYVPLAIGNPSIRVTEVDVAGTASAGDVMPPQVAVSVTEKTSARVHWGRFYMPGGVAAFFADNDGRLDMSNVGTTFQGAAVTFYNSCRSANMTPVVFSIQKPERLTKKGATLPAVEAVAYGVTAIQVDNVLDVIRRRRYSAPTVRTSTNLT